MYNCYLIVITFLCMYTCVYYDSGYIHMCLMLLRSAGLQQ